MVRTRRARAQARGRRFGAIHPARGGGGAHAQHGRGFRPAQAALKQSDAETDDEFLAMTDGELNRGSRLAQQVRPAEAPSSVDAHSQNQ